MRENSSRYDTFVGRDFHYQSNFEYLADLNFLFPRYLRKYFSGKCLETDNTDRVTTDFGKIIVWKKVTSIAKPREFGRVFFIYFISYDRIL